jgi:citronellyl-CoA dehydrogenase
MDEHKRLRESLRKMIDNDIKPHVDEWEAKGLLPAYRIFDLDDQP